ncbi:phospholipid-transporting ATPase 2 [Iris pallida]|uniref:Phospholipid-transporting ATPase 2 n=1 Tax=Iris pallida TaxID=29817 RepID=A0AAX6HTD8_IRIPA|nr:phospholipid-transporting ATPase 2 [Iris pallida]KAJ6843754.1 phospholipid-transporting ATPase 2 [Iris pallida]
MIIATIKILLHKKGNTLIFGYILFKLIHSPLNFICMLFFCLILFSIGFEMKIDTARRVKLCTIQEGAFSFLFVNGKLARSKIHC